MTRVALIPARGGSRRIPRKNIRPFLGRPVIAHPIIAARASGLFDEILVSTDDAEIAAVARDAGATTPFVRPADLADEHTDTRAVIAHAFAWLAAAGRTPDALCCLYATAVFAGAEDLRASWALLEESGASFVFAAVPYVHPVQRALIEADDGRLQPLFPEQWASRTQDHAPAWHDAGQFYWLRPQALDGDPWRNARPYRLPRHRVVDLDEPGDWLHAEHLCRMRLEAAA